MKAARIGYSLVLFMLAFAVLATASQAAYFGEINRWDLPPTETARGVAVAADGTVFLAGTNRVLRYRPDGTFLASFGATGDGPGAFRNLAGIAIGDNLVYTADSDLDRVQAFTLDGVFQRMWGSPAPPSSSPRGSADAPDGTFDNAAAVAIAPSGNVFVRDSLRVQEFSPDGAFLRRYFQFGWDALAFGRDGSAVVSSPQNGQVIRLSAAFEPIGHFGSPAPAPSPLSQFDTTFGPQGVAVMADRNIWVADPGNHRIQQFSPAGKFLSACGKASGTSTFKFPVRLGRGAGGSLFVIDDYRQVVQLGVVSSIKAACDDAPPSVTVRRSGTTLAIRASEPASLRLTVTHAPCAIGKRSFGDRRAISLHRINLRAAFPRLRRGSYRFAIQVRDRKGTASKSRVLRVRIGSGPGC